jgi:hypothetical protein
MIRVTGKVADNDLSESDGWHQHLFFRELLEVKADHI